jgi:ADP-ribose pyrophosphatase
MLINLCPHAMHIYPANTPDRIEAGTVTPEFVIYPATGRAAARLGQTNLGPGHTDARILALSGITTTRVAFHAEALPEPATDTWYIVSTPVAQAHPDRTDLLVPYGHVRDLHGNVIGSRGFARPTNPQNGARTYTHPDVLTIGVRDGWADPQTDPTRIDWTSRQARAAIPFHVIDGRPVNPYAPTGIRYGRNELGHWGEALAADALVSLTDTDGHHWILMVERDDGHGWALPGGHVDPDEAPLDAAIRELHEETGLTVATATWSTQPPRYVPDPRASDEAWMVTVLAQTHLGTYRQGDMPPVTGSDDAQQAAWVHACNYHVLVADLHDTHHGHIFPAHHTMLADALGHPNPITPTTKSNPHTTISVEKGH